MATKSIAEKRGIKPDTTVWYSPAERIELIEPMPERGRRVEGPEQAATAVVFVDDSTSARKIIAGEAMRLAAAGSFWVAYRKGNRTDINRDRSLAIHADHGMRPMGQVAIDDVWAGLALVPGMAAAIVSFQLASRLVRRIRPSVLISAGLPVVSAVCWCSRDQASTRPAVLVAGFALMSFGGVPLVALGDTNLVVGSAPPEEAGSAAALAQASNEFGYALGIALLGSGTIVYRPSSPA